MDKSISLLLDRFGLATTVLTVLACAAGAVAVATTTARADWDQWRGPARDGVVADSAAKWPDSLGEEQLRKVWRVELQPSYSGAIVAGDLVITTETLDQEKERTSAFRQGTGELVWQAEWEGSMRVPFFARANGSWIRATPAYDAAGDRLLVAGMRDVLVCLRASTGDELWRIDFVKDFETPVPSFGFVSSPLIDGGFAYVQAGAALAKVSLKDGEVVWRAMQDEGGMYDSAFSSPILAELAGRRQLVVQTRSTLAGLDPDSGSVLWSREVPSFRGMNILTPLVRENQVFTASYRHRAWSFGISGGESGFESSQDWEVNAAGYMTSPVEFDGHVYYHLQNQRFTCIDLASGEQRWSSDERFGKYISLVRQGGRILGLDERGELLLIDASPEAFKLLDRRKISDQECWAHIAVSRNQLFIRELNGLSAWEWVGSE